ncbi:MAG: hypothetical protein WC627_07385 [Legionella sp.]
MIIQKILRFPVGIVAGILGMVVLPLRVLWFATEFMRNVAVAIGYALEKWGIIVSEAPTLALLVSPFIIVGVVLSLGISLAVYALTLMLVGVGAAFYMTGWLPLGLRIGLFTGFQGLVNELKNGLSPFADLSRFVTARARYPFWFTLRRLPSRLEILNDLIDDLHIRLVEHHDNQLLDNYRSDIPRINYEISTLHLDNYLNNNDLAEIQRINNLIDDLNLRFGSQLILSLSIDRGNINRLFNSVNREADGFINPNNLVDVVVSRPAILDAEGPQYEINLLNPQELKNVHILMGSFKDLEKNVLPADVKNNLAKYRQLVNRYTSLSERLERLQFGLKSNNLEDIDDELVNNGLRNPILVFKQYLNAQGQWKCVPTISHIADREGFSNWLKYRPIHPITKDNYQTPPDYEISKTEKYVTRYQWFNITEDYCYAPELGEIANTLREMMCSLQQEVGTPNNNVTVGSSRHSVFAQTTVISENEYQIGLYAIGI